MKTFLTIWITAMMMVLELICGNMGLALGFPIFSAVYFAVAFAPSYGIAAAGFAGLLLDVIYDRTWLTGALVAVLITFIASETARRIHRHQPESSLLSGALCGLMILLANLCGALISGETPPGPRIFSMMVFQIIGGAIFMLMMTLSFDAINLRSNLPRFCPLKNQRDLHGDSIR